MKDSTRAAQSLFHQRSGPAWRWRLAERVADGSLSANVLRGDGYSFAALCLKGPNRGKIVEGREPEFEEVSVVAAGLIDFVRAL